MSALHGRPVAVAGIHVTEQGRRLEHRTSMDLVLEAVVRSLTDAGLDRHDVDGAAITWPGPGGASFEQSSNFAAMFGGLRWTNDEQMDQAGARGVLKAASAIAAGLCDVAVVATGRCGPWDGSVGTGLGVEFADRYGSYVAPQFALVARRHMHQTGTTAAQVARVAATIRTHGHHNPEAAMHGRGPVTVQDVLDAPMIASPLTRLMLCPVAEGGFGIVLTTLDRARDLPQPTVRVLGGGLDMRAPAYAAPARLDEVGDLGRDLLDRTLAGIDATRDDLGVLSLYDSNAYEVLLQLEGLGFVKPGEAGPAVEEGLIDVGGRWPVNLDGGVLSHSWTGLGQLTARVVEAVRQVRGTAFQQVPDTQLALAANAGSGAKHLELAVLGRDT